MLRQAALSLASSSKRGPRIAAASSSGPPCQLVRLWRHPAPRPMCWQVRSGRQAMDGSRGVSVGRPPAQPCTTLQHHSH